MSDPDADYDPDLMLVAGLDKRGKKAARKRQRPVTDSESEEDVEQGETLTPVGQKRHANRTSKEESAVGSSKYPDGYGSDLMGDEEDRAKMAEMNMLEREMEIFERGEKRRELMDALAAERKAQQSQPQSDKGTNMRSSTRAKAANATTHAKSAALAELNAARSAKEKRSSQKRRVHSSDEESLSDESYRDSGDESARSQSAAGLQAEELPEAKDLDDGAAGQLSARPELEGHGAHDDEEDIEFKQAQAIQLKRDTLQKWVHEPFFADTIRECLVRSRLGTKYVVARIAEVKVLDPGSCRGPENRVFPIPYRLERPFQKTETRTVLLLERGSQLATVPLVMLSNSPLERTEFEAYMRACQADRVQITSISEALQLAEGIKAAQSYVYTPQDIQRMVEEKRARGQAANTTMQKARLQQQLQHAHDKQDAALAATVQEQLAALDAESTRQQQPAEGSRAAKNMAQINQANAQRNFQNALRNVSARPGGAAAQAMDDVFARRSTRPMNYWATGKKGDLQVMTGEGAEAAEDGEPETPGTATATATQDADGRWSLHLDLSRIVLPSKEEKLSRSVLGRDWQPKPGLVDLKGKTILTLSDYRRRQGL